LCHLISLQLTGQLNPVPLYNVTILLYRTEKVVEKVYLVDDSENTAVVKVWDGLQVSNTQSILAY